MVTKAKKRTRKPAPFPRTKRDAVSLVIVAISGYAARMKNEGKRERMYAANEIMDLIESVRDQGLLG